MAAPTFVDAGATGVNGGNGTSVVVVLNGAGELDIVGEASNDIALVAIYKESTAAYTATPSGWNQLGPWDQDTGGFKYRADLWWRRIDGTETTATWSWSGSTWRYSEQMVYRNPITSETPVLGTTADEETAQNTTPTHPGITIARSNSGVVWFVFNFSDITNTTAPSGFTYRQPATGGSPSTARNILSYDDLTTSAGASGTVSATLGGDIEWPLTVLLELATEAAAGGVTGSGGLTMPKPSMAASGLETFTGSAALSIQKPSLASSGLLTFAGTGALSILRPSLAGTGAEAFTGTAAITIQRPSIAASGTTGDVIAGTGSLTIQKLSLAASGLEVFTGGAALALSRPNLSSTGALTFTGTASLTIQKPGLAATGTSGDAINGSASLTIQKPSLAASGLLAFAATGGLTIGRPSLAGSGSIAFLGTGTLTIDAPGMTATGTVLLAITGTGDIIIGRPSLSGNQGITIGRIVLVASRSTGLDVPARDAGLEVRA